MVRTFYSLEELEKEYDQANSKEEDEILDKINQLQLQCNMEAAAETSQGNPLVVQDSAQSGAPEVRPESQTQLDTKWTVATTKRHSAIGIGIRRQDKDEQEEVTYFLTLAMHTH